MRGMATGLSVVSACNPWIHDNDLMYGVRGARGCNALGYCNTRYILPAFGLYVKCTGRPYDTTISSCMEYDATHIWLFRVANAGPR